VTLTVTDNAGQTGFATQTITIQNDAPTADFTVTPPSPSGPPGGTAVVLLDASASRAVSGRQITAYNWTIIRVGTGEIIPLTPGAGALRGANLPVGDVYNITLTVTDNAQKTASKTINVTVTITP
jgi:hypothetical protein